MLRGKAVVGADDGEAGGVGEGAVEEVVVAGAGDGPAAAVEVEVDAEWLRGRLVDADGEWAALAADVAVLGGGIGGEGGEALFDLAAGLFERELVDGGGGAGELGELLVVGGGLGVDGFGAEEGGVERHGCSSRRDGWSRGR